MVSQEPKNEQLLCDAVMRVLAGRNGGRIINVQRIDTVVRDRPAVELIFETPTKKFAIEHTRIESFTNQIAEGKRFAQLLEPLEVELAGKLPGVFFLSVDAGAINVPTKQHGAARRSLTDWILAASVLLEAEEKVGADGNCDITATPPGVPFDVTLHRDCDYGSELLIMQNLIGDRRVLRRERVQEALARKCPKLSVAKTDEAVSVLILESDDGALANRVTVSQAVIAELAERNDSPDIVIWVRTSTRPWRAVFIKDGAIDPDIHSARLFDLDIKRMGAFAGCRQSPLA